MKLSILLALLVLLSGCDDHYDWTLAPLEYKCTMEQAKQVDYESAVCVKSGGDIGHFCFDTALIRNCTKVTNYGTSGKEKTG